MAEHLRAELVAPLVFAQRTLASLDEEAAQFAKHGKVLFSGSPRFNEFVVETSEDPYAINSRLLGHKMIGGLPLKKFYPELGDSSLWCCTASRIYSWNQLI